MTANTSKTVEIGDVPADQIFVTSYETEFQEEKIQKERKILT